jgi:hypothetical protein
VRPSMTSSATRRRSPRPSRTWYPRTSPVPTSGGRRPAPRRRRGDSTSGRAAVAATSTTAARCRRVPPRPPS